MYILHCFATSEKLNRAPIAICLYTVIADVREITGSAIAVDSSRARVFLICGISHQTCV